MRIGSIGARSHRTSRVVLIGVCLLLIATLNIQNAQAVPISGRSTTATSGGLVYSDNPVPYGKSPTTGLDWVGDYQPLIMVMSNAPDARPHWNLSEADIVYEAVYSGPSHTRYTVIYSDNKPEMAGGVRSARIFAASLRQEWDCPFVFWGWQTMTGTSVQDYFKKMKVDLKFQINGITNSYEDVLFRTSGAYAKPSPHNAAANLAAITAKYYPVNYTPHNHAYKFSDTIQKGYDSAAMINIDYGNGYNPSYLYNESLQVYERSYNGSPEIDGVTGKRIVASNVIVQRTKLAYFNNTSSRPIYELTGEGLADLYIGGRHIQGKWVRATEDSRTVFIDLMGNEVPLLPGKTFIQIVPNTLDYTYTRQDGNVMTNKFDEKKLSDVEKADLVIDDSELNNLGDE